MDQFCSKVKLQLHDVAVALRAAAVPDDRPSPLFSVLNVLLNGGLLVWSFGIVLDSDCTPTHYAWTSLGMMHSFVNMFYAVFAIFFTRRRIHDGILLTTSTWRLFLLSPLHLVYCVYLLWEIVWMAVAAQKSAREVGDGCANHMNVQVGFYVSYLLAGLVLFVLTFATEGFRLPRWRQCANVNWYMKNNPEALRQGEPRLSEGEEDAATEMLSRDSLDSDEPAASPHQAPPPSRTAQIQAQAHYEEMRGRHLSPSGSRVGTHMRQLPTGALAWDAHDNGDAFTDNSTQRDWNEMSAGGLIPGTPTERVRPGAPSPPSQSTDRVTSRSVRFRE